MATAPRLSSHRSTCSACFGIRSDRQRARRRQDEDPVRPDGDHRHRVDAQDATRAGVAARRALLPRHAVELRPVRRPGRPLRRHRVERLGVQGRQRLAARRRRQGDAEGRRPVLWYYADFGPTGGPPTLAVKAAAKAAATRRTAFDDNAQGRHRQRPAVARRLEEDGLRHDRHERTARASTPGCSCARPRPARSARTP